MRFFNASLSGRSDLPLNRAARIAYNPSVLSHTGVPHVHADGNCHADLADFAAFQNCLDVEPLSGACRALDLDRNLVVDLNDFAAFHTLLAGFD